MSWKWRAGASCPKPPAVAARDGVRDVVPSGSPGLGACESLGSVLRTACSLTARLLLVALLASCTDELASDPPYVLATATPGGTFYPVGVALATITRSRLYPEHGISLTAISSAGSLENIRLLRDGQAQFALLQGVFAAWAWHGEGPVARPQTQLRSVSSMWLNVEHFVLRADLVGDGTLMDLDRLDGHRYVLGARNSGAAHTGAYILSSLGINFERRMNLAWMGYGATADALQDGNVVGMNIPAGVPVGAITRAYAVLGERMTILGVSDAELAKINRRYPLWEFREIPAGTYPNQHEPIRSIAHANVLAVHADVPEETVYQVTRSMWENLPALRGIHQAATEMEPERALIGLAAPLHPGALRWYREQGLDIPPHLEPP